MKKDEKEAAKKPRGKKADTPTVPEETVVSKIEQIAQTLPPVEPFIPQPFVKLINESGISQKKATSYLVKYSPILAEVEELSEQLAKLDGEVDEDAIKAKAISIELGKICSRLTEQKKSDKEGVLKLGRFFDALFNTVNDIARAEQQAAKGKAELKAARIAAEQQAIEVGRSEQLAKYYEGKIPGLGAMPEEVFQNMLSGFRAEFEKAELENAAKAQSEAEEQEAIRQAAEEAEKEREEEMNRLAELAKVESEKAAKMASELADEKNRATKMAEELRKKREEEELAEALKQEAINKANAEAEAQKGKPVAEQLIDWLNNARLTPPPMTNDTTAAILVKFEAFRTWAIKEVEKTNQ